MARSLLRQDTQIHNSEAYLDTVAAGATLESSAVTLEDDLNALRSQVHRILDATASGNWYDAIATVNSKTRSILQLNTDLNDLEEKKILCRANVLTDVAVPASQNWVILNVAGSEAPTQVAAVSGTTNGAVVAQSALSGAGFNVHELIEVAGPDATNPKNLVVVRSAANGQKIQSSGRDVFGLLQYESTGTNGGAFNDTSAGNRVKISFVRLNSGLNDLEAVPVADIESQSINYHYVFRSNLDAMTEDATISNLNFVDHSASVDVTRQNAYTNQGTTPVELANNADLDLGTSIQWAIRDVANTDLLNITEGSAGGTTTMTIGTDVDSYQNAVDVDFNAGITANEGGTRPIAVGVTDGVIATTAGDLRVLGFAELYLDDGNQTGSTWAQTSGIKLSDTTAEWDAFETNFGEVSLLQALNTAYTGGGSTMTKYVAAATTDVAADTDVGGPSSANNLDADLGDYSSVTFLTDVDVFLNGQLLRNGANAAANNDVYPGTTPADGELRFEFGIRGGAIPDVVTMFIRS
jgi:hypothetical protein